ncbi:hypothetical protein DBT_0874 [Dissulfuribacter thermophilus]|uniref:Uncharacterized protein n=1 Tax=Dissulfuribacter thermophilus TaxID=1156395 RepID=A0A1B9F6L1_9BACT|nr:hypothetical protein DBT_0874 [Dissulfuribacter thermophilus]
MWSTPLLSLFSVSIYTLNAAISEFAQDTRSEGQRRTQVLRAPSDKVDWAKSPIPKGGKRRQKHKIWIHPKNKFSEEPDVS